MLLILLAMRPAAAIYWWCQRHLPSNRLIRRVRTRAGLRWGTPLALLGVVYFFAGVGCAQAVADGGSGWWNLGVLVGWWTALKLVGHGLFATIKLPYVRAVEASQVRRMIRAEYRLARHDDIEPCKLTRQEHRAVVSVVRNETLTDRHTFV